MKAISQIQMAQSKILAVVTHIGRRAYRHKISVISIFFLIFFIIPVVLYTLLGTILANDPRLVPHAIRNARNVLLITAHPDDESLFFSPSILHNSDLPHVNRHLLVLSSGNWLSTLSDLIRKSHTYKEQKGGYIYIKTTF